MHAAVVGEPCGNVRMTTDMPAWGNHITEGGNGIDVPAFTIKQICDLYQLSRIDLLKMDIEGAESDVFRNGEFLNSVQFIIAELHGAYSETHCAADVAAHRARSYSDPGRHTAGISLTTAQRMRLPLARA
jgi:hypothetical protein